MARQDDIVAVFDEAHSDFVALARGLSPEQWLMVGVNHPEIRLGEDERRPVGVIAHHVAMSYGSLMKRCRAWIEGVAVEPPSGDVNERHAAANPEPDQAATIALLESGAEELRRFVRGLSDSELEARGQWFRGETNVAEMAGGTIPFHIRWHAESIRATLAGAEERTERNQPSRSS
jgi:hypothetical protein